MNQGCVTRDAEIAVCSSVPNDTFLYLDWDWSRQSRGGLAVVRESLSITREKWQINAFRTAATFDGT